MTRQRQRLLNYVGIVVAVVIIYTLVYAFAMGVLEGRPRSFLDSLLVVTETLTTVGYGEDAPWSHPLTQILVIGMQLSGILLVFAALPLVLIPYLEERLATSPPNEVTLSDHVVICGFSTRGRALIEELIEDDVEYVLITDRETATDLTAQGYTAIPGDPETIDALERASITEARAVVIDSGDEANAAIALAVSDVAPDVETISYVEDPSVREYQEYAGVDRVLSPRELLGRGLADRATSALTTSLGSPIQVGDGFELVEMPIDTACELDGVRLGESRIRERTGANVVGAWRANTFVSNPGPDFEIDADTALVVAGSNEALAELKELTLSPDRSGPERVIVVGYGQVGRTAREGITAAGLDVTVVDIEDRPGVDVIGDATDRGTLTDADIQDASAFVTALPDDTDTIYTTLLARQLDDEVEILCRAEDEDRVETIYSAGADYVIALGTVSGRMLAATLLDEEVLGIDTQIDVVRVQTDAFAGETLASAQIRERTGCTVVAVERDGELLTDPDPDVTLAASDTFVVAGTDEDITRFNEVANVGPAEEW
jgi:Trk K+ transport system NAD-binding subunit